MFDDDIPASFLEADVIDFCTRVGNHFVFDDDVLFRCGGDIENEILIACQAPIDGDISCKSASAGVEL